ESREDIEDRVEGETRTDQQAAQHGTPDAAKTAESRAPRHTGTTNVGAVVVRDKAVDQRLGAAGAQSDDGDDGEKRGEREAEREQHERCGADRETTRD